VTHALDEIERALERFGLLLEHDKELPSVTTIVAGEPIAGSWWGHPLGHQIYELIGQFSERSGVLWTKIVNGKVTYVHPRLWSAFLTIADADPAARLAQVSTEAAALYASVKKHGPLRADAPQVPPALSSKPRELSKAIRALEGRLLVQTDSLHTESGAHVKVLRTWSQWRGEHAVRVEPLPVADAKVALDAALAGLCRGSASKPKVPW
jgi:hypothetical protein